jgi:hypothetical protein
MLPFPDINTHETAANIREGIKPQVETVINNIIGSGVKPKDQIAWCDQLNHDENAWYVRRLLGRIPNQGPRIIACLLERDKPEADRFLRFKELPAFEDQSQTSLQVTPIERYLDGFITGGFDPKPCLDWLQGNTQEIKAYFVRRLQKRFPEKAPQMITNIMELQRPSAG